MCENFWDLGACNKLNRRSMNYGHVGCSRTLDWVLIPGTPFFSMRMWKHSAKFVGSIWSEQMCSCADPKLQARGRSVLLKFRFLSNLIFMIFLTRYEKYCKFRIQDPNSPLTNLGADFLCLICWCSLPTENLFKL